MRVMLQLSAMGLAMLGAAAQIPSAAAAAAPQAGPAAPADPDSARATLGAMDFERLTSDRDYAAEMLGQLDRVVDAPGLDAETRNIFDGARLLALVTLERRDQVAATLDRMLARRPRDPGAYAPPIYAALWAEDDARTVAVVETASRNVAGVGWGELREVFDVQTMGSLLYQLRTRNQNALRVRLAEALFRIGWPGAGELQSADMLRTILLEDRLAQGDRTGATEMAASISSPGAILPLIVQPRFDEVLGPGRDRVDLLRSALAEEDRTTAAAVAAAPEDPKKVLARVNFLRSVGRNEEAVALVRPLVRDPAAAAATEEGMWLFNEGAYALIALGREDEARDLMSRLLALPMDEHPSLISMSINHAEILSATGRPAEALSHATRLQQEAGEFASDYGDSWIASAIACALARLNRGGEAAPQIERLRGLAQVNPAALTQAYLCLGDTAAAEALLVERLGSDDPADAILALQDYELSRGVSQSGEMYDRLLALRDRPAVRAALARVGRSLRLPLARSYWGNF